MTVSTQLMASTDFIVFVIPTMAVNGYHQLCASHLGLAQHKTE